MLLCLLLAAYLSAAETAITGASRPRMHRLAQQGNKRATIVNALLDRKDEAVSAVLLGNNVVNILSASLTTAVLTALFGAAGIVYATMAIGVMVVIFAEVMPKTWALLRADRVALMLAPSIVVTLAVLGPMARAVAWISRFFLSLLGVRVDRTPDAEEHADVLRGAIELHGHGQEGETAPAEKAMLQSVLDLGDRTVGDVMTHRGNVVVIDADQPMDAIVSQMLEAPYTRIPVYRTEADNIIGVVHAKDLFRAVKAAGGPETVKIEEVMTPALVHSRIDDAASTSSRPSAPGTSISPSSSTSTARCAASSPSRTSSRRSPATSRTSTTPSSAAWSGARTAA